MARCEHLDDHPRNHAVIAKEKNWNLSPAYDLTPSVSRSIERRDLALECGDMGRYANAKNILSQHARFLLDKDEAEKIVNNTKARVAATGTRPCAPAVYPKKTPRPFAAPSSIRVSRCSISGFVLSNLAGSTERKPRKADMELAAGRFAQIGD